MLYLLDEWKLEVYVKAVKYNGDNIAKLMDLDLVANCLVSEGIFSSADESDVSTAGDKVSHLLKKVQSRNAYRALFSILLETGAQLPAHGRLHDILSATCSGI